MEFSRDHTRFLVLLRVVGGEGISTKEQNWTEPTSWRDGYAVQRDQRGDCQEGNDSAKLVP